ncbi:M16 family metallopeptidase [Paracnuella aquatica]|uniref:M16 family metallopeptidase n=1 Tax=Paracnuella aquatica TaxID=2268757 RepID=UPI000DEF95EE|nr:pitrilysin family protein [Paracnuella aquatica]RPD50695.1 insulinase family protein [Paracnuella aquatica]
MKPKLLFIALLLAVAPAFAQTPQPVKKSYPQIDIPFKKFVLPNGLTLIVHEDHKAPVAAFNIWYHVGSKNEKLGKTGFAHLFEHLMFNGSEHYNDDYFQLMDSIGATDLNGTTNNDRTNYFQTFPVSALDKVLWVESDRMGYLLKAVDSAKLAEQRGVVQNEKRQWENQPYSVSEELTVKSTYPANHPYSWTVIGSMEDLDAASLKDVHEWFKAYYGPNNAVVVIAGDVDAEDVRKRVEKYFGDIPASPPIAKHSTWIAPMKGKHFQTAQDRVPQARLQKVWNIPGWGTQEMAHLNLLGSVLTEGKTSRLYKRLVYDDQLASNVYFYTDEKEIGGQFFLVADAKPGVSLGRIDSVMNEELIRMLAQGPTPQELERAKTRYFTGVVKGLERIGGFGGKSDILAQAETYAGDAGHYKKIMQWVRDAAAPDLKKAGQKWMSDGEYVLHITPYPAYTASAATLNRAEQPPLGGAKTPEFPAVKQFTLSNGLKVALVERKSVPVVNMSLMINAGYAADQFGQPGLASLVGSMLTEGTKTRSSLQLSDQMADLGASVSSYSDLDNTYLYLSALKSNLAPSLALFSDVLLNPAFPQKDFERVKEEQLLDIKQEQAQPVTMGLRILPKLLYGSGHAYSNPFTGSGTEASVQKITRQDLQQFQNTWFAPNNATLVVVGDVTEAELKKGLEQNLAQWKSKSVPQKNIGTVAGADKPSVYIIDKPEAQQSIIFAAAVSPSAKDPQYEAMQMANKILGGEFTSRINMNLRENKHWSYGAFTINLDAKGPSFFTAYAPVQTDKTKESIQELQRELKEYVGERKASAAEFGKMQGSAVLQLPGMWETNSAVLNTLQNAINYERGMDYLKNYPTMLRNMQLTDVQQAANKIVQPQKLTWVIVGDKTKIEKGIQELNLGPVKYIDSEGVERNDF